MIISWELVKISYFENFWRQIFAKFEERRFFYSLQKSGGKWPSQKLIFSSKFDFFIFLWQTQKQEIWCRYRLSSNYFTFISAVFTKNTPPSNTFWGFEAGGGILRNFHSKNTKYFELNQSVFFFRIITISKIFILQIYQFLEFST